MRLAASGVARGRGDHALARPRAWRRRGKCASPAWNFDGHPRVPVASRLPSAKSAMEMEESSERAAPERRGGCGGRCSCKGCVTMALPKGSARGLGDSSEESPAAKSADACSDPLGAEWRVCASVLHDSTRTLSPRFEAGKGEEALCGSATPDEAGESPTGARPEGCADGDGQLVAAPASEGGRMPHEKL